MGEAATTLASVPLCWLTHVPGAILDLMQIRTLQRNKICILLKWICYILHDTTEFREDNFLKRELGETEAMGSAIKSTYCFCRELEFHPRIHIRQSTTTCSSSPSRSDGFFWFPMAPTHMYIQNPLYTYIYTYIYTHTYKHTQRNKNKRKRNKLK